MSEITTIAGVVLVCFCLMFIARGLVYLVMGR